MSPELARVEIEDLVAALAAHHGFRTVWLDPDGRVVHTEPDDDLGGLGYRYVTTVLRPDAAGLAAMIAEHRACERPAVAIAGVAAGLV